MIRKILSILFAGLLLFNLFGYFFVFKCDQIQVKNEMKGMIRNGSLRASYEKIIVQNPGTNPDFKLLEKGEIEYQGKLYDVISSRVSGTSVIFTCIKDTKEEQLLSRFSNSSSMAGMNLPEKSKNSQALLYHIIKHALLNKQSVQPPLTSFVFLFTKLLLSFHSISILPDFPPPRFV